MCAACLCLSHPWFYGSPFLLVQVLQQLWLV